MRHRVESKTFGREMDARRMLFRNLVKSMIEHGQINTTLAPQLNHLSPTHPREALALAERLIERTGLPVAARDVAGEETGSVGRDGERCEHADDGGCFWCHRTGCGGRRDGLPAPLMQLPVDHRVRQKIKQHDGQIRNQL